MTTANQTSAREIHDPVLHETIATDPTIIELEAEWAANKAMHDELVAAWEEFKKSQDFLVLLQTGAANRFATMLAAISKHSFNITLKRNARTSLLAAQRLRQVLEEGVASAQEVHEYAQEPLRAQVRKTERKALGVVGGLVVAAVTFFAVRRAFRGGEV